jgi:hypothetical protein
MASEESQALALSQTLFRPQVLAHRPFSYIWGMNHNATLSVAETFPVAP